MAVFLKTTTSSMKRRAISKYVNYKIYKTDSTDRQVEKFLFENFFLFIGMLVYKPNKLAALVSGHVGPAWMVRGHGIRVNSASGQVGPGQLGRVNSAGSSRPYI